MCVRLYGIKKAQHFFLLEIPDIKAKLTLQTVLQHYGLATARNNLLCCPFHQDKTPSLQLYPRTNTYHCFGCGKTGDVIQFIEDYEQLTKHQSILKAKALINQLMPNNPSKPPADTGQHLSRIAVLTKFYQSTRNGFAKSQVAQEYAQTRGLDLDKHKLAHVGQVIPKSWTEAYRQSAEQMGLLRKTSTGSLQQRFKGCLLFPLLNDQQQVTGLYGRSIDRDEHHYLPGPHQGLYPHYPHGMATYLVLTESVIDAATLVQHTDYQVLALYGTNGLTEEHSQVIRDMKELREVILFFDGDEAGRAGVAKISERIQQIRSELTISSVPTPDGEDVNSLAISHEPAILNHLLEQRQTIASSSTERNAAQESSMEGENAATSIPKPQPAFQSPELDATNPNRLIYTTTTATYYIKGGIRAELDTLRVSLDVEHPTTKRKHRSKPDLYEDKQVSKMATEAADKLNLRADLLILDIERLTDLLESYRESRLQAQEQEPIKVSVPSAIAQKCIGFLSAPNLLHRFNELIGQAGVVGEERNRLFLFVIATSYKMPDTLHALIQGSSGSGKTHLLIKISSLIPDEEVKRFTRVTDSSFYNYGQYDLQHKLICLEDFDGMREEAQLAFRELQSREMLSSSTSGKDEQGNIRAFEKVVYGPIASLCCTTRGQVYEDNMSRCFLIAVDESREQTSRIITHQNQRASGKLKSEETAQTISFMQHCLRMLKPYPVINPFADQVSLPPEAHKIRRLNDLYQSFVRQVTLLNQYRRKQDSQGRLISEKEDLQTAADIMFESILLKVDELDGSLRHFYEQLKTYVQGKAADHADSYAFTQREVRQALRISKSQLQRFLYELRGLEYIQLVGGHLNKGYHYKITYWDSLQALRSKVKRHLQGQLDQLDLL